MSTMESNLELTPQARAAQRAVMIHGALLELADTQRSLANALLFANDEPSQILAIGNAKITIERALVRLGQALA